VHVVSEERAVVHHAAAALGERLLREEHPADVGVHNQRVGRLHSRAQPRNVQRATDDTQDAPCRRNLQRGSSGGPKG
jgi:hypothetical protein